MKINLGCGRDIKEGYLNTDIRKTHPSVLLADVERLPFKSYSVEEIFACDILEHLSYRKTKDVLKEWHRVLQPGGKLFIQSPHLKSLCLFALKVKTLKEKEMAIARIFGGQEYKENCHLTAVDTEVVMSYLTEIGFYLADPKDIQEGNFGNRTNIRVTVFKEGEG
jgi:predicted SAM-dependent methyltransferase